MLAALRRGLYFQSVALTREDHGAARKLSKQRGPQERWSERPASLDEFLASLEMMAEHGPVDAATLPRVTQLINKTNQFNLTTRRYTEEQVRAMAASAGLVVPLVPTGRPFRRSRIDRRDPGPESY